MANQKHFDIYQQGVEAWNRWREENPDIEPDLSGVDFKAKDVSSIDLSNINLRGANLRLMDLNYVMLDGANLSRANLDSTYLNKVMLDGANLSHANLYQAVIRDTSLCEVDLTEANLFNATLENVDLSNACLEKAILDHAKLRSIDLRQAHLSEASLMGTLLERVDLSETPLHHADLREAKFHRVNLIKADLSEADLRGTIFIDVDLSGADLTAAHLLETQFHQAKLNGCCIYGISAWNVQLEQTEQSDLIITFPDEPTITVDDLEVAQFIYLLISNRNVSKAIDTITSKVVLILGNFEPERLKVLHDIKEELRTKHNLLPVVFDFTPPHNKDLTQTVSILANLSRFVIVDFTQPRSAPFEFSDIISNFRNVPLQLIIEAKYKAKHGLPALLKEKKDYPGLLHPHFLMYRDEEIRKLLDHLKEVIERANKKTEEFVKERSKEIEVEEI